MSTTNRPAQFAFLSRILHWLMAALLVAMLFIGISMVASLETIIGSLRYTGRWVLQF